MATLTPNGDAEVIQKEAGTLKVLSASGNTTVGCPDERVLYTVPVGKKATIKAIFCDGGGTTASLRNVFVVSSVEFEFNTGIPAKTIFIANTIVLNEGDEVKWKADVSAIGNLNTSILYQEFDQ